MTDSKIKLKFTQFYLNPFLKTNKMVEFYEYNRDDQSDDADFFIISSQNILNKNLYESYKSFFYRYQDYNQINR